MTGHLLTGVSSAAQVCRAAPTPVEWKVYKGAMHGILTSLARTTSPASPGMTSFDLGLGPPQKTRMIRSSDSSRPIWSNSVSVWPSSFF